MTRDLKERVYEFWQAHPLGSFEINPQKADKEYFEELDRIRSDSSMFSRPLYGFEASSSKKVLDAGCGPGWITVNYAKNGAQVSSVDLTPAAAAMAKKHLELYGLKGDVRVGDVEELPFDDNVFDFVCCDGVIHHTPDIFKACRELFRVLKPGGRALISFYYKNWYLNGSFFPLTRFLMYFFRIRTPHGFNPAVVRKISMEEFGKLYDGKGNPMGRILAYDEGRSLLERAGFKILKREIHYFPVRFLPFGKKLPLVFAEFLDRFCGTMIYFILEK